MNKLQIVVDILEFESKRRRFHAYGMLLLHHIPLELVGEVRFERTRVIGLIGCAYNLILAHYVSNRALWLPVSPLPQIN